VILAHTIKGWTLGKGFEGRNSTHQMKKLTNAELKALRDRLYIDISDKALDSGLPPYFQPGPNSAEIEYMQERRAALGGPLPKRVVRKQSLPLPGPAVYDELKAGSGKQPVATTMAFVRLLKDLMKDKGIGARFVPVVPDEARTFGMDAMFPTAKIYSPFGQRYEAVDRELLLSYKESTKGQILHEGITEAGSMASTIAAGSSYATHGEPMIPVYIFYSMFGFQRTADQMWQMGDQLARGFLLGATAGRTTLNGEGLQHQDGHSLLYASTNPAVVAYDAAYGYEIAFIVEDGLNRMYGQTPEDVFYYLTVYNEPYPQPAMPDISGLRDGVLRGMYKLKRSEGIGAQAQVLASGVTVPAALAAQELLRADWGIGVDVWSVTSWNELRRDALVCDEHAFLHPEQPPRTPFVTTALMGATGPVLAVSDWMRAVPDQISRWVPTDYSSLGTDGFGRSDTRAALRRHFHIDAESIATAVLEQLAARGEVEADVPTKAIDRYRLREPRLDTTDSNEGGDT
jgi:pyruvate dehydrogenase E1 component